MSGIGAGQKSRIQVQNPQPHGHKHLGLVVFADLGVHRVQDLTGAAPLLRPIVDEDFCRHHKQRRRNPLVRDIRDQDGQMAVIDQEEVIEVSSHLFGRCHAGIEVEVFPVGKCGENMRQHGFLDLGCRAQFRADTLLLGGNPGEVVGIVHNTVFHGLDLTIQVADFIIGPKIQLDHIVLGEHPFLAGKSGRCVCQLAQRADCRPTQQDDAGNNRNYQQHGNKHQALSKESVALTHDLGHIEIHTGDADGFPGLQVGDGFDGGEEPAELRVVDRRRYCRVILVI